MMTELARLKKIERIARKMCREWRKYLNDDMLIYPPEDFTDLIPALDEACKATAEEPHAD